MGVGTAPVRPREERVAGRGWGAVRSVRGERGERGIAGLGMRGEASHRLVVIPPSWLRPSLVLPFLTFCRTSREAVEERRGGGSPSRPSICLGFGSGRRGPSFARTFPVVAANSGGGDHPISNPPLERCDRHPPGPSLFVREGGGHMTPG